MNISIFGLGYVGVVSAGCLASMGNKIIGVDIQPQKNQPINDGCSPIIEKDLEPLIKKAHEQHNLSATSDVGPSVLNTDISLICVGTPSQPNGSLDLRDIRKVCGEIGSALLKKETYHLVVFRSTMLPGSMFDVIIPALEEASGKKAQRDFGVAYNPEFLREGTAVNDFFNPPKTVLGIEDEKAQLLLKKLYKGVTGEFVVTDIKTAEMVKYTDNVWHALKVGYANEIGNICKSLELDSHKVMGIFCKDTKLNLSPYYLKPGFAFGGSCLPKDLRALSYKAKNLDLTVPIIDSILPSNVLQIEKAIQMITQRKTRRIGILGISFKAGTDDLRESPIIEVIERLIGKGYDLRLYDKSVRIASLFGANKEFILNQIPHISSLMVATIDEVINHAETIVISNKEEEYRSVLNKIDKDQTLIDLVRLESNVNIQGEYNGICW